MGKAGGFHLIKLISNSTELLLSIPKTQRKIGVKDQDLSGQLPNKKALGIWWVIGNDAFNFKIKLDERPLTERMMLLVISSIYNLLWFVVPFVKEERRILQSICQQNVQWDVKVFNDVQQSWNKWKRKLKQIEQLCAKVLQTCWFWAKFLQLVFVTFLTHLSLVMSNAATSGWLVRKAKFIAVYC